MPIFIEVQQRWPRRFRDPEAAFRRTSKPGWLEFRDRQYTRLVVVLDFLARFAGRVRESQPVGNAGSTITTTGITPANVNGVYTQPIVATVLRIIELTVGEGQPRIRIV